MLINHHEAKHEILYVVGVEHIQQSHNSNDSATHAARTLSQIPFPSEMSPFPPLFPAAPIINKQQGPNLSPSHTR